LYGLKQFPTTWNQKLNAFLKNMEFVKSDVNFSMYVAQVGDVKFFIVVCVDENLGLQYQGQAFASEVKTFSKFQSHENPFRLEDILG
jgi:hypothetical protein